MKTTSLLCTIVIAMFFVFSCTKEKDPEPETPKTGITYPDSIYYGNSILNMPDSATVISWKHYGFAANLEKDASLTIKLIDLSVPDTTGYHSGWYYGFAPSPVGWTVLQWNNNGTQTFIATQTGKIDLLIKFYNENDTPSFCRLDFYENSTTITRSKYLKLQKW